MTRTILLIAGATLLASCGTVQEPKAAAAPAVPVTTIAVAPGAWPSRIEAGGTVQARTTATITSRILAPIASLRVIAGDRVRAGEVLVVLDNRDLDAQSRRAAAGVSAEEHALAAARADRDAADAALTLARTTHERVAMLHERRSATDRELDEAVEALRAAEARQAAAASRVEGATASLSGAREGAAAADVASSFATIRAPFDGIVAERYADPGNLASPGAPLLRLEDTRSFRLEVRLDAQQAAAVTPGQAVDVTLDEGAPLSGRVVEVSRATEGGSQSVLVKIELPRTASIRSGTFGRAHFSGTTRQALVIPRRAVIYQGQLPTVFVVSADVARVRVIRIREAGEQVEVAAGLAAGDQVITAPPPSLRDGDRVVARAGAPGQG